MAIGERPPKATVFIPTYRGAVFIEPLVREVMAQRLDEPFDVLIYDTASGDETPQILERLTAEFPNLRWRSIPKAEFSLGATRQRAAEEARGEFVVYLTQDATPAHDRWLYEMLRPFAFNERIVAVLGKQEPRPDAPPLLKSEIRGTFASFGPDSGTSLFYKDEFVTSPDLLDFIAFYSDVNSAARRRFLTETIPYRDVPYSEDMLFAREVIEAGYIKAYAPRACVLHSNEISLGEYKHRLFDETLGLRRTGVEMTRPSMPRLILNLGYGVLRDWRNTLRDHEYGWSRKLYWLAVNPLFHIEKWRGVLLGVDAPLDDAAMIDTYSLEKRQERS